MEKTALTGEVQGVPVEKSEQPPSFAAIEIAGALQSHLRRPELQTAQDFNLDLQQEAALYQIGSALIEGRKSGYIEMATGTGKTVVESILADAAIKAGKRVLMIAPRTAIAEQLNGNNQGNPTGLKRFTSLHDSTLVQNHFGQSRASKEGQVVITTYNGLVNQAKESSTPLGDFDIVIADECHRSLGLKTAEAMKTLYPDAIKLGFSATPDYATDRKSDEIFEDQLFEYSLLQAIEDGTTASIRTMLFETNQELELTDNYREFTERELEPLITNSTRNHTALTLAKSFKQDGRQGIISCIPGQGNLHARIMARLLESETGVRAADLGAHLSPGEFASRLELYHSGELDVLTFTRALEEGWDSANTSYCINMTPTASPVRTKQLLGRVLRPNHDGRESIYIDFIDKTSGMSKDQYTALHALEYTVVDSNRVLGRQSVTGSSSWMKSSYRELPSLTDPIIQQLLHNDGVSVREIMTRNKTSATTDLLAALWESRLKKDGLPANLPDNDILGPHAKAYEAASQTLFDENYETPTQDEVLAELARRQSVPTYLAKTVGRFGIKLSLDCIQDDAQSYEPDYLKSIVGDQLHIAMDTFLSKREAYIIRRLNGLDSYNSGFENPDLSYDSVGDSLGVSRERVRQIASKSMAKLRHPRASQMYSEYAEKPESDTLDEKPWPSTHLEIRQLANHIEESTDKYRRQFRDARFMTLEGFTETYKRACHLIDLRIYEDDDSYTAHDKIHLKSYLEILQILETDSLVVPAYTYESRSDTLKQTIAYYSNRIETLSASMPKNPTQQTQRKATLNALQSKQQVSSDALQILHILHSGLNTKSGDSTPAPQ